MRLTAIPVLPSANVLSSLDWWTSICGFVEVFRDTTPPLYAGISRDGTTLHLSTVTADITAREVGDQTMVRFFVDDIDALYAEYQQRGGKVHPNGALQTKPWGTREFSAIDPNGVCVTFQADTQ
jgi:uncharacterized glyoxalase superfamily protein PhnB